MADKSVLERLTAIENRLGRIETLHINFTEVAHHIAMVDTYKYWAALDEPPRGVENRHTLFVNSFGAVTLDGLWCEFGVAAGHSLNLAGEHAAPRIVHGFDSFEGIPEAWGVIGAGAYTQGGRLPQVRENVRLHVGMFDETLPQFTAEQRGPLAFLHIDCDLYSSTRTVFQHLGDRIVPGTIIQFDEYWAYPAWQKHEFKAWQEFVAARGIKYRYVGFYGACVSVVVI